MSAEPNQAKRLAALLRGKFRTAREIATRMQCSRIQAYRRLQALQADGVQLATKLVRERATGPLARAYMVID